MGLPVTKRALLIVSLLFFGLLTLTALGTQLIVHLQQGFDLVSFFSYFTYLSNLFAALVLLVGAGSLLTHREPSMRDDILRGSAVASMAIVGIVFSVFLRDANLGTLVPWVNIVLHYVMPVVMVASWLILPPQTALSLRQMVWWLIYPALYLVYILIRGRMVGLYPYPFLTRTRWRSMVTQGATAGWPSFQSRSQGATQEWPSIVPPCWWRSWWPVGCSSSWGTR
jgi:hypothetical protein